jgi:hypothetical protein
MNRTLLTIAASFGLALTGFGVTATPVHAHDSFGYIHGPAYPYYPNNYYPNYYYPYEYYTPHLPNSYNPYYSFPYNYNRSAYISCYTLIKTRVYWQNGKKYVGQVPLRTCSTVYPH